jgi:hypothetical protein
LKSIIGAAIILADIIAGVAAPEVIRNLHREHGAHLIGSVGFYVVLALLTLWVIASVLGGTKPAEPAPRPGYTQFRQGPRR